MRDNIYVGLVHYPVYNKNNDVVATSVTNFDIHDISRTCRTYDIKKYFIITPVDAQQELTNRIINYWTEGDGIEFNKNRKEAFENTDLSDSVEAAVVSIAEIDGNERNLKGQFKLADRIGVEYTLVIGSDELAQGKITVKNMRKSEQYQMDFDRDKLIEMLVSEE